MMLPSASTRIGTLKPNASMLLAICRICFLLCRRGLAGSELSLSIGRYTTSKFEMSLELGSQHLNFLYFPGSSFIKKSSIFANVLAIALTHDHFDATIS